MQIRGVSVTDGTVAKDPATELVFPAGVLTDLGHGKVGVSATAGLSEWGQASSAKYAGAGSPVGSVTPSAIGDLYVDETGPGLWQATGVTNTSWQQVGAGGSQPTNRVVVPISSAQLLSMSLGAAQIEIVSAPEAGSVLVPLEVVITFLPGTTPYANRFTATVEWDGQAIGLLGCDPRITGTEAKFATGIAATEGAVLVSAMEAQPLVLSNNDGIEIVDGDGTLLVTLLYMTADVA